MGLCLDDTKLRIERSYGVLAIKAGKGFYSKDLRIAFIFYLLNKGKYKERDIEEAARSFGFSTEKISFFISKNSENRNLNTKKELYAFIKYLSLQPAGYTTTPLKTTLWITNACNLRCIHCGNSSGDPSDAELSTKEIITILKDLERLNVLKISITGGEPAVRKDFCRILREAKKRIPYVSVTTNGWATAKKTFAKKVSKLVNAVKISIDGLETHDLIRGNGSFENAVKSIDNFIKNNVRVRIQTTIMRLNIREIPKLLEYLARKHRKIERVDLVPVTVIGRASKDLRVKAEEYQALRKTVLSRKYPFTVRFVHSFENGSCQALKTLIDISYDGTVYPCSFLHIPIGNVRENTIQEIWTSKKAENIRALLAPDGLITMCEYKHTCNGGCAANGILLENARLCDRYCWRRWDRAWTAR